MTKFWFDTNFFLPATKSKENLITLKTLLSEIKHKYPLYTTRRIKSELDIGKFKDIIHVFFTVVKVEDSDDFREFCRENKRFLGLSKSFGEPADLSLAYIASKSPEKEYIVTNDEGFLLAKNNNEDLMRNVEIWEPTDFLKDVLVNNDFDDELERKIEELIISYAEHFIMHRLEIKKGKRPIERILRSILAFGQNISSYSTESTLPENYRINLRKYIHNKDLSYDERNAIKPAIKYFKPFAKYYASCKSGSEIEVKASHRNGTKSNINYSINLLYLQMPELLDELNVIEFTKKDDILQFIPALRDLILKEIFSIRIQQTVSYLKDCYFDEAFYHFRPILETYWSIPFSKERKSILKLLFGIFLLNLQDFQLFKFLLEEQFWDEYPRLNTLFETLFRAEQKELKLDNLDVSKKFSEEDLNLLYHLGLYFANTGNRLGLEIFNLFFHLDNEILANLDWYREFLERYLLELRIHQIEISNEMKEKFLAFLQPRKLQNNTGSKLDRNYELEEFTAIKEAPYFYRQPFFLINYHLKNNVVEAFCWNNTIRSIVILKIPQDVDIHLENVRSIKIEEGYVRTKKISPMIRNKKNARIIIEMNKMVELGFERFEIRVEKL